MSFKDNDETPAQRKSREFNENPKNHEAIRVTYCHSCGCHYTGGCKEHSSSVQKTLVPNKK
jgi:hypothetical protein